jgi:hypothetical protein
LFDITRFEASFDSFIVGGRVGSCIYLIIVGEEGVVFHIRFQINCAVLLVMGFVLFGSITIVLLELFWRELVEAVDYLLF